ncbi:MAG: pyrroline-5-carboxylate reductase [Leptospiraceae bacterium]|nr:pyrroline-5-carboxylate reductase [Leptospiraceae bacterium]
MENNKKIGIVGIGNMGFAIFNSIKEKHQITIYDPYKKNEYPNLPFTNEIKDLEESSEIILLCVKPDQIKEVLSQFTKPLKFISIAAGITVSYLKEKAPVGSQFIRLMPNLPLLVNEGAMDYIGDKELYPDLISIFGNLGILLEVPKESLMDSVTGLAGSGPAFVFSFIHSLAEGGVKNGLKFEDSLRLAIQTVKGSAEYLESELNKSNLIHPALLRNRVTSPGGTTIFGLEKLEEGKFHSVVMEAVNAAVNRSRELGKK